MIMAVTSGSSYAQMKSHHTQNFYGGIGTAHALTDIGGGVLPKNFGPADINIESTGFVLQGGYEWRLQPRISLGGELNMGFIRGDDKYAESETRNARNLSFRTGFTELTGLAKFYLLEEKRHRSYHMRGLRRKHHQHLNAYVFVGVGGMYFNPKAKYQGSWVALQPLGTEGQGIAPGTEKYSRLTLTFPVGFGIKYNLDDVSHLTLRASYHYTRTDYLDDASTLYYNNDEILAERGEVAAALANRSEPDYPFSKHGSIRGNPEVLDGFTLINVAYHRRIKAKKSFHKKYWKHAKRRPKVKF